MAVSTPMKAHNVPLPDSPATLKKPKSKKGKGKERSVPQVREHANAEASSNGGEGEVPWEWESLTDSFASVVPPVFTKDGSYFFSVVGPSVKIYSVATGQVVSTLSAPELPLQLSGQGSSNFITSAVLNPHNAFQLITGSLNGCIMVWDFLEASLLQVVDIGQPIQCICAHEKFKGVVFVAATRYTRTGSGDDQSAVLRVSLKPTPSTTQSRVQKSSEITPIGKTRSTTGLSLSPSGAWLVAVAGHKAYVASSSSFKSGFTKYVSPERLTCLAFHPSEEYFATGDDKGNIRLWYCLNDNVAVNAVGVEKKAQTTTLHWHAHSVASLAFTSNGAYLLSGGEESVLVIWQLHTGKKEFVPRVGAPIKTVSLSKMEANEEEYLLGLSDATYVFVSAATLKISRSYSRIKLDSTSDLSSSISTVPLAVHSLTSTLIIPSSHASSLQTYSPTSAKLISELEVSPSNRVSRRDEKPIEPTRVERSVIDRSGKWMATIDSREGDESFRGEIYLKLWLWDSTANHWILNTRVDRPHGLKTVTAVAFSPTLLSESLSLVTTGQDGNVKTWRVRTVTDKSGASEEFWVTRSTFSFRSQTPTHASWSQDGSLLAVTVGQYVALYDPMTNILCQTLTSPECKHVTSAHFVGRGGRYLAVIGFTDIVLWDLIAQGVQWHHNSLWPVDSLVPHTHDNTFAVFYKSSMTAGNRRQTKVHIFDVASSVPAQTNSVPFGIRAVTWYPTGASPELVATKFSLVGITDSWSVVLIGDKVRLPALEGSTAQEIAASARVASRTLFQDIFGKSAFANISREASSSKPTPTTPWTGQEITGIFDGPAYLLPPLESLFEPLMGVFLKERPNDEVAAVKPLNEIEDEDVDMEDGTADQTLLSHNSQKRLIDQGEMDGLVDLFRRYSVKSKPSSTVRPPPAVNGFAKHKANGVLPHSTTSSAMSTPKQKSNGLPVTATATPVGQAASSPVTGSVNGKKRKKAAS